MCQICPLVIVPKNFHARLFLGNDLIALFLCCISITLGLSFADHITNWNESNHTRSLWFDDFSVKKSNYWRPSSCVQMYINIIQFSTDASWEALEWGPTCSFSLFSGPRSTTRKSALLPPPSRHRDSRAFFRPSFFNVRFQTAGVIIDLLTATRAAGGCNSTSKSSPIFTVANRCACQLSHAQ